MHHFGINSQVRAARIVEERSENTFVLAQPQTYNCEVGNYDVAKLIDSREPEQWLICTIFDGAVIQIKRESRGKIIKATDQV
ncbi:MAG TPA: hypothetical protein VLE47_00460 [Candidatus Saccharimonadales bacterium]|nr:hypothetical protein [Candidatus Saccharimonadales bacterium]